MRTSNKTGLAIILLGLVVAAILFGCRETTVAVSVHGVDYNGTGFNYFILNAEDPEKIDGGEHIEPYSAGGTTCCAELPKKWVSGTRLTIATMVAMSGEYLEEPLREIKDKHVVDVPPYVDGKPGELWVLHTAEGKIDVVSSDVQPDHPKWPGAVKGWPVPSYHYRLKRWEISKDIEEDNVELYESFLRDLQGNPQRRAREAWDYDQSSKSQTLQGFTGSDDPRYLEYLRSRYELGLSQSKIMLKLVMDARP